MENTNVVTEEVTEVKVEKPVVETVAVTEKKGLIQAVKDKNKRFVENHPVATKRIKKGLEIGKDVLFFGLGVATVVGITKVVNGDSENSETAEDENIIDGEYTVTEQEQTEADASEVEVVEF